VTAKLLTVDDLRARMLTTSAMSDEALQGILDGAEADIDQWCGRLTLGSGDQWTTVEQHDYGRVFGQSVFRLDQYPEVVLEVAVYDDLENETILEEGRDLDYVVDGQLIRRYGALWGHHSRVTYVPLNDLSQRRNALVLLCQLELNVQPGQGFTGAATWQETYKDYETEKQHILWSLCPPFPFA